MTSRVLAPCPTLARPLPRYPQQISDLEPLYTPADLHYRLCLEAPVTAHTSQSWVLSLIVKWPRVSTFPTLDCSLLFLLPASSHSPQAPATLLSPPK